MQAVEKLAVEVLPAWFRVHPEYDESHGLAHALRVRAHCEAALAEPWCAGLSEADRAAVAAAALIHDLDDEKYAAGGEAYPRARAALAAAGCPPEVAAAAIEMVGLVSMRRNGWAAPPGTPAWKLLPRDADRLDAVGWAGVARCVAYGAARGRPLYGPATPAPALASVDVAASGLLDVYLRGAIPPERNTTLDIFFYRLLHTAPLASASPHIRERAAEGHRVLCEVCAAPRPDGLRALLVAAPSATLYPAA